MGNTQVTALDKWWLDCKQKGKMIRGPYVGFLLKSPENKTVVIFGENHNADVPCSPNEELFTDLFQSLIINNKKEPIKIILELCEDTPIYFSKNTKPEDVSAKDLKKVQYGFEGKTIKERVKYMPNPDARLHKMLKIWSDKCYNSPSGGISKSIVKDCKIDLHYSNQMGLNTDILREITNDNASYKSLISAKEYTEYHLERFIKKVNPIFKSYAYMTLPEDVMKTVNQNFGNYILEQINSCLENLSKINKKTPVKEIKSALHCGYDVGRFIIDYYAIINTLSGSEQVFVYQGFTHSIFLTAYLMRYHKYRVVDIAIPQNVSQSSDGKGDGDRLNCMRFSGFNTSLKDNLQILAELKYSSDEVSAYSSENIEIILQECCN